ncbi:hypothetical protein GF389_04110 [Candidatus Dojkabacteria bacterium]|nr:hypothetical protein [Candidatus Dojkabacteria bacterium]
MTQDKLQNLTSEVQSIVKEVGDWVLSQQMVAKKLTEKEKGDYATDIDLGAERRLVGALKTIAPEIGFETEEQTNGENDNGSGLRWVIDPIDGTKNYFRKLPLWSVNVALYDPGTKEIQIGVVYFPKHQDMFVAYKGGGAYRNGMKCQPSDVVDSKRAIVYGASPSISNGLRNLDYYNSLAKKFYRVRDLGHGAGLCYVADGGYDAFIDVSGTTKNYDIMASILIATEAGCDLVDFDFDKAIKNRSIIVTNGKLKV